MVQRRPLVWFTFWLAPAVAFAAPVEIELRNQVPIGQKPAITLKALERIRSVHLELTREDDGKTFTVAHGPIRQGQAVALPFGDGQGGHARWRGKLQLTLPDGNGFSQGLTFETGTIGELKVGYRPDTLDLAGHAFQFTLSRPAGHAEIQVFAKDGSEIGSGAASYHGEAPGSWLRVEWAPSSPKNVLRLELSATSADGLKSRLKLVPWMVPVAHEEVIFESGKGEIRPDQEAKLEAAYQRIVDTVAVARKADASLAVKLFIAGHTDTVGATAENRKLSVERARALGAWFRDHGLPLPIEYAGFGEEALKVKTPDNTDEPRNRRADYIVGFEEPLVARGVRADWHPLE